MVSTAPYLPDGGRLDPPPAEGLVAARERLQPRTLVAGAEGGSAHSDARGGTAGGQVGGWADEKMEIAVENPQSQTGVKEAV
jgi:hypothetical protein